MQTKKPLQTWEPEMMAEWYLFRISARTLHACLLISTLSLVGVSVLGLSGCSWTPSDEPELGTVSGTVTMDGRPLPGVWVGFAPATGRSSNGLTDKNGHFELNYLPEKRGAKVGSHKVAITTPREDESGAEVPNFRELVPPQYNARTTLTADVKSGHNEINFPLTKSASGKK